MARIEAGEMLAALLAGETGQLRQLLDAAGGPTMVERLDLPGRMTLLMAAAACGNAAAVDLLLEGGADPARRDADGHTAAAHARRGGHPHLAARLDTVVDQERRL
ncbi:MAG: ankyrin repeat domain-containing protein [Paracraurococcus sp.]|jgi:ankyrin repeat protein